MTRYSPEHEATIVTVYVPSWLSLTTHCTAPGPFVRAATVEPPLRSLLPHRSQACTRNSHGACVNTGMGGGMSCEREPDATPGCTTMSSGDASRSFWPRETCIVNAPAMPAVWSTRCVAFA